MSGQRFIEVGGICEGWLAACRLLLGAPGREATNVVVRMTEPLPEDTAVRAAADAFTARAGHASIAEVRNTIFPAAMAERHTEPGELAAAYMEDYRLRSQLAGGYGTYFGRICEQPSPNGGGTPQLEVLARRLREASQGTRWRSVYQVNIYAPFKDQRKNRGFPCMAHLAFDLGRGARGRASRLDCTALYRSQDLTMKGYGNYLGLAQLQAYLAAAAGFDAGELMIVAGHLTMTLAGGDRTRLVALTG